MGSKVKNELVARLIAGDFKDDPKASMIVDLIAGTEWLEDILIKNSIYYNAREVAKIKVDAQRILDEQKS